MSPVQRPSRSVRIREVAAAAGVSVGTVSNVLNRPEAVSADTRERVLAAVAELGYVRNESARMLRAGRSRVVALVVLDVANPFFTDVARGVEEEAHRRGYAVVLCNSDQRPDRELRHLQLLEEQRVHGVLITPTDEAAPQLAALRERGTPVVLVDRPSDGAGLCSASVDDAHGAAEVMRHLLAEGHRRTAFVGGPFALPQVRSRHRGFVGEAQQAEVLLHETQAPTVAEGRAAGDALAVLPVRSRPTAVFCANDLLALGVLQSLSRAGVRVPEDVALVGYDDVDLAASAAVPLSSVRQPREELGRVAAQLLFEEGEEGHAHREVVFRPELVVRESSGTGPTPTRPRG